MIPDIHNATPQEDTPPESEPETEITTEVLQDSALLKLPTEVLQTITWHMDVGTFFASLLTCRTFFAAAQSRPNLSRHINSIPGLKLGLEELTTPSLLLQFRQRAAESGCAAGVLSDVTLYSPASRIPLSNAVFSPATLAQPGAVAQLATIHEGGIVQIYDLGKHHVRHKTELQVRRSEDEYCSRIEILKMAFSPDSRDLAVLSRSCNGLKDPFEGTSSSDSVSYADPTYRLITFHRLFAKTKKYFYSSSQQETRDINNIEDETPVGLALASNGNACIAWKHPAKQNETKIMLIGRDEKLMEACSYDPTPDDVQICDPPGLPPSRYKERLIFNIQFVDSDRKVNFYKPGNPIHSWYTPTCDPSEPRSGPIFTNMAFIDIEKIEDYLQEFAIGMPFHATHSDDITVDWSTRSMCQISYLALGISKRLREFSNPDVFIMQADTTVFSTNCDHSINFEEGRKLPSWKALALLAGYREGSSSLGTVMAVSPRGTKIAAATWSQVLVWSLSPRLLHQGELQHYFPTRDYNSRKGLGRLRPTLLPSQGVVHSMLWTNETQLYATTDQGLAKWDMGHLSEGEKDRLSLAYDAWPDTAVAAPVINMKRQQRGPGSVPFR